ncbi:Nramp family divalent metal transporter [Algoriphagus sp. oki45]|uniref:NRAMP family divalent metal transporter n=1 Tax=Algoriphagus sp. oki45 TaxID=3067294 RepID=UPI0027E9BC0C|nr:Nramp family divalent metal transporter [Algoriphagus sp. oki45]
MKLKDLLKKTGPGPLVTAAFIGPGTVTVCSLAGIQFDYTLLWALGLSLVATLYLQEISGRLGLITRMDLSELLKNQSQNQVFKILSLVLVFLAIGLGNAAYEGGNLTGANLGLGVFWEAPVWKINTFSIQSGTLLFGGLAFFLLWSGNYKTLEKALIALVILMSLAFLIAAGLTRPDWSAVFSGFIPVFDQEKLPTLVALIGTTVVPYNLFLYASLAKNRWVKPKEINAMRWDISLAVILGVGVSMSILIVGVANPVSELQTAADIAQGLRGVFGEFASYLMGFGLMAAGLTSTITAPLAGGLVICGLLGKSQEIQSTSMRISMGSILLMGIVVSSLGMRPFYLITSAQLANGILLPIISGWLIWAGSQSGFLGDHANSKTWTFFGFLIWVLTLVLGLKSLGAVFGWF